MILPLNKAYTLQAYALTFRDITPFGRNVVYAENVIPYIPQVNPKCKSF